MQHPVARRWSLLQAMYYGPATEHRIGSSCSVSDVHKPPRPRRRRRVAAASRVADDAENEDELPYRRDEPPAYVVLDVQSKRGGEHGDGCHVAPRPGRRRARGNAIRILLLATAAAFLALAVSPGKFHRFLRKTAVKYLYVFVSRFVYTNVSTFARSWILTKGLLLN